MFSSARMSAGHKTLLDDGHLKSLEFITSPVPDSGSSAIFAVGE
jgi:hypothetical protein